MFNKLEISILHLFQNQLGKNSTIKYVEPEGKRIKERRVLFKEVITLSFIKIRYDAIFF